MSRRFIVLATLGVAGVVASLITPHAYAAPTAAVDDAAAETEFAKNQFLGQINAANVMVRSGPSENDYATMRLDRNAEVTVVGMKFNWLKIVPPEGSFSYVSKLYIERFGDGTHGRAIKDGLNVWVGSSLTPVKAALQVHINRGAEVEILGEADEFLKIRPPEGAFLWVNQNLVTPVRQINNNPDVAATPKTGAGAHAANGTDVPAGEGAVAAGTTQPSTMPAVADSGAPTTMPAMSAASAEAEFGRLEGEFKAAEAKPLEEQPVAELKGSYEDLLKNEMLPSSMRRIAQARQRILVAKADSKVKLIALHSAQGETDGKLQSLRAERTELEERVARTEVQVFAALGTLQPSSLQFGQGGKLYRLTDPATGRTACYIRSADVEVAKSLNTLIGVRGTLTEEPGLGMKVVNAVEVQAVDVTRVNKGVTAAIIPPSISARPSAEARTE